MLNIEIKLIFFIPLEKMQFYFLIIYVLFYLTYIDDTLQAGELLEEDSEPNSCLESYNKFLIDSETQEHRESNKQEEPQNLGTKHVDHQLPRTVTAHSLTEIVSLKGMQKPHGCRFGEVHGHHIKMQIIDQILHGFKLDQQTNEELISEQNPQRSSTDTKVSTDNENKDQRETDHRSLTNQQSISTTSIINQQSPVQSDISKEGQSGMDTQEYVAKRKPRVKMSTRRLEQLSNFVRDFEQKHTAKQNFDAQPEEEAVLLEQGDEDRQQESECSQDDGLWVKCLADYRRQKSPVKQSNFMDFQRFSTRQKKPIKRYMDEQVEEVNKKDKSPRTRRGRKRSSQSEEKGANPKKSDQEEQQKSKSDEENGVNREQYDREHREANNPEKQYVVESVLMKRIYDGHRTEYLIKWKDFNEKWNSWEPQENLKHLRIVKEFEKNLKKNDGEMIKKII